MPDMPAAPGHRQADIGNQIKTAPAKFIGGDGRDRTQGRI